MARLFGIVRGRSRRSPRRCGASVKLFGEAPSLRSAPGAVGGDGPLRAPGPSCLDGVPAPCVVSSPGVLRRELVPVALVAMACRLRGRAAVRAFSRLSRGGEGSYLVDPASSHMLVSKIKPCMSKYKLLYTVKLRMAH